MQYHLNGYRPGDPSISEPLKESDAPSDCVDVLIVGCGPAGLTLAAQLSMIGGIDVKVIERKPGPLQAGQADGIACRSVEMFQAFGFADRVIKEGYQVNEVAFWRPSQHATELARVDRIQDVEDGLSEMPHIILNQARVHDFYLEVMQNSASGLVPDYNKDLIAVTSKSDGDYPLIAEIRDSVSGATEAIRSNYVVGCDGARSTIRRILGTELQGEAARQLWGVMDVLAITDFPDIRLKAAVQSADHGSILIIPREGGYMVRLYIELDELNGSERAADRNVTPELLIDKAKKILNPYELQVKEVVWWSAYEIGQRLCDRFDDRPTAFKDNTLTPRIFIAGDACHTHSPKAGQGMNVSMADSFNLGWKLAAVIRGQSSPELLNTYSDERYAKAKELIDFDKDMARLFSAKPETPEQEAQFQRYFQKHGRYTAGVETCYQPSLIIHNATHQALASGYPVGKRFHSAPVVRVGDAKPMQLGHTMLADGRWRIIAFAASGDSGSADKGVAKLCAWLQNDSNSPLQRYTPANADVDSVFDVRAVFQTPHHEIQVEQLPTLLLPRKGCYGLIDYEKAFSADLSADIFDLRGINRTTGALLLVRPDQYVADILPTDDCERIAQFFDKIMVQA